MSARGRRRNCGPSRGNERERIRKLEAQVATLKAEERGKTGHFSRTTGVSRPPGIKDSVYWTKTFRFTNNDSAAKWDLNLRNVKLRLEAMDNASVGPHEWWSSVSVVCVTCYGPFVNSNLQLDPGTTTTDRVNGMGDISVSARVDLEAPIGSGAYPDYSNLGPQMAVLGMGSKRARIHWTWSEKDQGVVWQLSRITEQSTQGGGVNLFEFYGVQGNTSIAQAVSCCLLKHRSKLALTMTKLSLCAVLLEDKH